MNGLRHNRRRFLGGSFCLAFASLDGAAAQETAELPADLARTPALDAWIRVDADGAVVLFTGKVELGQGVLTAFAQICADELDVDIARLSVISGDTRLVPYQSMTVGSVSIPESSPSIRAAAAEVRAVLLELAAARLGVAEERLAIVDGTIFDRQSGASTTYWSLVGGRRIARNARGGVAPKPREARTYVGTPTPRIDLRAKLIGRPAFIQDLVLDAMVHARVVRPPGYRATLEAVDVGEIERMPGVLRIVRDASFLAVIADREWRAIKAAAALRVAARWSAPEPLPADPTAWLLEQPAREQVISDKQAPALEPVRVLEAAYSRPHIMHGAIGPSCAVAHFEDDELTLYTHSQGPFELGRAVAELLHISQDRVRVRFMPSAGCYGHNGADDAAAEAALLARASGGRPVRLVWSRADEHLWEPYGPAMYARVRAGVDTHGSIVDWRFDVWSTTHVARPVVGVGNLHCAQASSAAFPKPDGVNFGPPAYAADRDAIPGYAFANQRVTTHFIPRQAIHCSSLRSLGAHLNVFATESMMDELARAAGEDAIAFRLRHTLDPRAREVMQRAAAKFGWAHFRRGRGRGRGFAYARYKGYAGYCGVCLEVEADRRTGVVLPKRAVVAVDVGDIVNPDGVANQVEGALLQTLSWTLRESVQISDGRLISRDWRSYPILRFSELPAVEVELINRPDQPPLGAGEVVQGPGAGALGNAVFDALGVRLRDMPLTPNKVMSALERR